MKRQSVILETVKENKHQQGRCVYPGFRKGKPAFVLRFNVGFSRFSQLGGGPIHDWDEPQKGSLYLVAEESAHLERVIGLGRVYRTRMVCIA
jgi:hypothetical protein